VMNYRVAELSERHRAMLDFAHKLTASPDQMGEDDRQRLRDAGFSDRGIWDIANIAGFYNMTNRVASAVDMQPNPEYHSHSR
ncbi:MAG: peroxidase-related enzyme, partial [Porticoccaceae bacterium]|nr:peroxidase-related enzyme [Porticoccaceae bacterium]